MSTFVFKAPNKFVNKTYTVKTISNNLCEVKVISNFLGSWSFEINMDYDLLCSRLHTYCNQDIYIQRIFPELTPEAREKFLTDPKVTLSSFDSYSDYTH
jgi:hypothetical protein